MGITLDDGKSEMLCAGVLQCIGKGFLGESVEYRFDLKIKSFLKTDHLEINLQSGVFINARQVGVQGRFQPQIAQKGRVEFVG